MTAYLGPQDGAGGNMGQTDYSSMETGKWSNGVQVGQLNQYVTTTTSGLGISVASGKALILGFLARSDAAVALTAAAADPSNPRIDRAVLHADLSAHTLTVQLLTGSPAPVPAVPSLTQTSTVWEIALYQVRVNAGATTISSLTDERTYSAPNIPNGTITDAMLVNAKVNKSGDTMTGGLTVPQVVFAGTLSASNQIADLQQSFGINSDNAGGVFPGGTSRLWFSAANTAGTQEMHFGPRGGSGNALAGVRFIANNVIVDANSSGSAGSFKIQGGVTFSADAGAITTNGSGTLGTTGRFSWTHTLGGANSVILGMQPPDVGAHSINLNYNTDNSLNFFNNTTSTNIFKLSSAGALTVPAGFFDNGSRVVVQGAGSLATSPIQLIVVGPSSANLPAAGVKGRVALVVPFSLP